ncbi:hypothetical protein [Ruania rhizosphaerae]|uniref:hypothetical protein n=1 Tax=Ruania rhizosphaerae TaxID=1840413 RepID=UPI001357E754|nr:hypothetical protein [Ruania rhizosphaerae]
MTGWVKIVEGVPVDAALAWVAAIAAAVTALATIGLLVGAVGTLTSARRQLSLLRAQAEREGRPYVVAEVVPGFHGAGSWDLIVRNYGRTSARQITYTVEGLTKKNPEDHIATPLASYLESERWLAPGARERVMWRHDPAKGITESGVDARSTVRVRYRDELGTPFSDTFVFDTGVLGAIAPVPTTGPEATSGADKPMRNLAHALRAIASHIGELRR